MPGWQPRHPADKCAAQEEAVPMGSRIQELEDAKSDAGDAAECRQYRIAPGQYDKYDAGLKKRHYREGVTQTDQIHTEKAERRGVQEIDVADRNGPIERVSKKSLGMIRIDPFIRRIPVSVVKP